METSPCSTQESVLAAAAAIGALPSPLSFEKIPRLIPFCIAITIVIPVPPPKTAWGVKADLIIKATALGNTVICDTSIKTTPPMYNTHISGITFSATEAILLIPPIVIKATAIVRRIAVM